MVRQLISFVKPIKTDSSNFSRTTTVSLAWLIEVWMECEWRGGFCRGGYAQWPSLKGRWVLNRQDKYTIDRMTRYERMLQNCVDDRMISNLLESLKRKSPLTSTSLCGGAIDWGHLKCCCSTKDDKSIFSHPFVLSFLPQVVGHLTMIGKQMRSGQTDNSYLLRIYVAFQY